MPEINKYKNSDKSFIGYYAHTGSLSDINWSVKNEIWFYIKGLCYAVAGVLGLVSGLRVYNLWNVNGRHHVHIDAAVISWAAAAIFLVVATAFINMTLM